MQPRSTRDGRDERRIVRNFTSVRSLMSHDHCGLYGPLLSPSTLRPGGLAPSAPSVAAPPHSSSYSSAWRYRLTSTGLGQWLGGVSVGTKLVPHTAEWRFAAHETIVARASVHCTVFVRRQTAHLGRSQ
eukprot:3409622-Prymnesium_polylepis.1